MLAKTVCFSGRGMAPLLSRPWGGRRRQEGQAEFLERPTWPPCHQDLAGDSSEGPSCCTHHPTFCDFRASDAFPSKKPAFRFERRSLNKTEGDL